MGSVTERSQGRVHIVGAGPVGLFLTALLQGVEAQEVVLYERRPAYTRTRMVSLAKYLVAETIDGYNEDVIDGQDMRALFEPTELEKRLAYRHTIAPDLGTLLHEWTQGFVALNTVEARLSELIESRATGTCYNDGITHVTGIVTISEEEFHAMPPRFDGAWLRDNFPEIATSMDGFINRVKAETHGELVGDLEITRIPLDVYHAWNNTTRRWFESGIDHPLSRTPVFLLGDAAIGSPYFQSISLGFECAFFVAGHLANRALPMSLVFERYENLMYQQWLRVYMRSHMIKHNKDLLQRVDDREGLLALLHIF